ncbi:MAG TPA: nuclear transport factor 2 family protein [Solirubrobacterales bacterium]|nr:nuclear transport factor 2 family protein [Solirubrobacterales bacterium]
MPKGDPSTEIEALYAAFNRRDIETVLAHLAPDVHWANGMEGGYADGREAVRAYWTRQFAAIHSRVEPETIELADDGRVAVQVHQVVHAPDGELLADERVSHYFTFEEGRIARFDIGD